jgi:hypothetical protein
MIAFPEPQGPVVPELLTGARLGLVLPGLEPGDRARMVGAVLRAVRRRLGDATDGIVDGVPENRPILFLPHILSRLDAAVLLHILCEEDTGAVDRREIAAWLLRVAAPDQHEALLDALQRPDGGLAAFDDACLDNRMLDQPSLPAAPPSAAVPTDEASFRDAADAGDHARAMQVLAAAAQLPVEVVETTVALRNARGLVSLAWRAGFSIRAAELLQRRLANLPEHGVLRARPDGSMPMTRPELLWQLRLVGGRWPGSVA